MPKTATRAKRCTSTIARAATANKARVWADYLALHRYELPCLIRHGMNHPIVVNGVPYQQVMPGDSLSAARITNLLNYVENHWGNQHTPRTIRETADLLRACP